MANFALQFPGWPIEWAFARVHRISRLTGVAHGGGLSSHFNSSPGSLAGPVTVGKLVLLHGLYHPGGLTRGPIHWSAPLALTEQYSEDRTDMHQGYTLEYRAADVTAGIAATWLPASRQLSWAVRSLETDGTGPPGIVVLGEMEVVAPTVDIVFDIDDTQINPATDLLLINYAYRGSEGLANLSAEVDMPGWITAPLSISGFQPAGDGLAAVAADKTSGVAASIHDANVVASAFLLLEFTVDTSVPDEGVVVAGMRYGAHLDVL